MTRQRIVTCKLLVMALLVIASNAHAGHRTFSKQERAMMGSASVVFESYFKIASSLAHDSVAGIAANAGLMAAAARKDRGRMFPPEVAADSDALAGAKDLPRARIVFKALSKTLIQYLGAWEVTRGYQRLDCPVAKASWLEKSDTEIENPYLGRKNPRCAMVGKIGS